MLIKPEISNCWRCLMDVVEMQFCFLIYYTFAICIFIVHSIAKVVQFWKAVHIWKVTTIIVQSANLSSFRLYWTSSIRWDRWINEHVAVIPQCLKLPFSNFIGNNSKYTILTMIIEHWTSSVPSYSSKRLADVNWRRPAFFLFFFSLRKLSKYWKLHFQCNKHSFCFKATIKCLQDYWNAILYSWMWFVFHLVSCVIRFVVIYFCIIGSGMNVYFNPDLKLYFRNCRAFVTLSFHSNFVMIL